MKKIIYGAVRTACILTAEATPLIMEEHFDNPKADGLVYQKDFQIRDGVLKQIVPGKAAEFSYIEGDLQSSCLQFRFMYPDAGSMKDIFIKTRENKTGAYLVIISPERQSVELYRLAPNGRKRLLEKRDFKKPLWVDRFSQLNLAPGKWYQVDIEMQNDLINVMINNYDFVCLFKTKMPADSGKTSIGISKGTTVFFDDIKIWEFDYSKRPSAPLLAARDPFIRYIMPEKLFYYPDAGKTTGKAEIRNPRNRNANLKFTVSISFEPGEEKKVFEKSCDLKSNELQTVNFPWYVDGRTGGFAMIGRLYDGDKLLHERREYFGSAKYASLIGHTTGMPVSSRGQTKRYLEEYLPRMRRSYTLSTMRYGWSECVATELTPEKEEWISSFNAYRESKKDMMNVIKALQAQGIEVYSYVKHWAFGNAGMEFIRKNPEWAGYRANGHFWGSFSSDEIQHQVRRKNEDDSIQLCFEPDEGGKTFSRVDKYIDEIMRSQKMFGWNGVFFDSAPGLGGTHNWKGESFSEKYEFDGMHIAAKLMEYHNNELKRRGGKHFDVGMNYYVGTPNAWMADTFRARNANSFYVYEQLNRLEWSGTTYKEAWNLWHYWYNAVGFTTRAARADGGQMFAGYILQGSPAFQNIYSAMTIAQGGQIACHIHHMSAGHENIFRLALRMSQFIYGRNVRIAPRLTHILSVNASREQFWQEHVFERYNKDGKLTDITLQLVNPPTETNARQYTDIEPPMISGAQVTFRIPEGRKLMGVYVFKYNEPIEAKASYKQNPDGTVTVTMPDYRYYSACVFQLDR